MPVSPEAARWFEERRGIHRATLEAFGVRQGSYPLEVVIPYGPYLKARRLDKEGKERFYWPTPPPKGMQPPLLPPGAGPGKRMFLVEGDTDMMALYQNAPEEFRSHIVAVSGVMTFPSYVAELFADAKRTFVIFDNDTVEYDEDSGELRKQEGKPAVEIGWQKVREALGRRARRVQLPPDVKDVAEFFQQYDWAAFQVLLEAAAKPVRHYPRLDLTQPVPDTDWLVEELLIAGELTVIAGDGGSGKSMIMQALALAITGGEPKFLGLPVKRHGRVLYVDHENSMQLVLKRLQAMGMDARHIENLEYLWYAGVDVNHDPGPLLEEALDLEPELIILDSLTGVSPGIKNENDNAELRVVMRERLLPIVRESGVAIAVVHHTNKDGQGRPRGASEIRNAAEQSISIARIENSILGEKYVIRPDKARREGATIEAAFEGHIEKDGYIRIKALDEDIPM